MSTSERKLTYKDPDWLYEQYVVCSRTLEDIADECNIGYATLQFWIRRHGIEPRPPGVSPRHFDETGDNRRYINERWLWDRYWGEWKTLGEIAEEANCSDPTILNWMVTYDIPRRKRVIEWEDRHKVEGWRRYQREVVGDDVEGR